jgi:cardiolipin synthase (CMP-forming)
MADPSTDRVPGPEFIDRLVAELQRQRYSVAGFGRFFAGILSRARSGIWAVPSRTRSFIIWASFGAMLGAAALLVAASARPGAGWTSSAVLWAVWYAGAVTLVLLMLDMLENQEGVPYRSLLLPNGLTFLRLGHAPLVCSVLAAAGSRSLQGRLLCVYLALLAGTDLVDGLLARALRQTSRLGAAIDTIADMSFLASLATGLHRHGMISTLLLALYWVRYPGALVGGIVLGFARGPQPLQHTLIGRATSFSSGFLLVAAAVVLLAAPGWLHRTWVEVGLQVLTGLLVLNIGYLVYRAATARTAVPESG